MDYFDLAAEHGGCRRSFPGTQARFCVVSFSSDWLFPTPRAAGVVHALNAVAANVSFVEVETDKGHDAFLLEEPEFYQAVRGFLDGCAEYRGLTTVGDGMSGRRDGGSRWSRSRGRQPPPGEFGTTSG